ncbi:agmatinase family protein [Phaeocystidibacter luteus]|uniref:Agmatinase family protein n=1 Tax=Phaeocystidibacter luteus TaxID=911197 RepID=A0A6N6RHV0_9FLAO|nr:agmatinase family protein [Phaeocystidibacter luteus]KAB2813892.1 agmatinase family protein [Phaeocystidibacter luteus]
MTKQEKIDSFDPNGPASGNRIFGLPFSQKDAEIVILPVPWEVTVSYDAGTALGPEAILEASKQVDLYDPFVKDAWKMGIYMAKLDPKVIEKNRKYRDKAVAYLSAVEVGHEDETTDELLAKINKSCKKMVNWVQERTTELMNEGKRVILLGGDHSTPLGYLEALAKEHEFGILQIDAHADLRNAYEGFTYSHASIMFNALKIDNVKKLVQVGIRDYCEEEVEVIEASEGRVKTYFDRDLKHQQYAGATWKQQVDDIISQLPQKVYVSFDIDGLDPKLCPHTGTPVAGGFESEEVMYLFERLSESGKTIIGMDLNEVAPGPHDEWDANVGARLLYRMANLFGKNAGVVG